MKVFRNLNEVQGIEGETSVSIGTFDGIHIGHRTVLAGMKLSAVSRGLKTLVYTFSNNPAEFIKKQGLPKIIMDVEEKIQVFADMGIDYLVIVPFDEAQAAIEAEQYVKDILIGLLRAKVVTVGHDFKFGRGGSAGADKLRRMCEDLGVSVNIFEPVAFNGTRVSSTEIRRLLEEGRVEEANILLGHLHFMKGKVVRGKQLGRKLGIPTINLELKPSAYLMRRGVYFTRCRIGTAIYNSVTNVGHNPTISDADANWYVETHVLDFNKEVYGEPVVIEFLKWHRAELSFEGLEALKDQLLKDIESARMYFQVIW